MVKPTSMRYRLFRYSTWDAAFLALAVAHGILIVVLPVLPVIAFGVWWNSNTISHNFVHKPFFRSRWLNVMFALYLSVLLGIPQSIWKARHLAHHAAVPWRLRITPVTAIELLLVAGLWGALLVFVPKFFLTTYMPAYAIGLSLCYLHGFYEHVGGTTSHYGSLYNWLFFNDGFHVEHHTNPGTHWVRLPQCKSAAARASRWPAVFRWLGHFSLDSLERVVLRSRRLQQFVLSSHERAFRRLFHEVTGVRRVAIVGGGLFPRTAIVLCRVLPSARIVVVDASAENLTTAAPLLPETIERIHAFYDPSRHSGFDAVVIPLAFIGDREKLYRCPPAPIMFVHDWLWRPRGRSTIVSVLLLKRLNLICPTHLYAHNLAEHPLRLCRY